MCLTTSVDAVSDKDDEVPGLQGRRRLVIMGVVNHSDPIGRTQLDEMSGEAVFDGDMVDDREGQSNLEVESAPTVAPDPVVTVQAERLVASFEWLASLDMETLFTQRLCIMKSVPGFMKGSYRAAMRIALNEIDEGRSLNSMSRI